MKTEFKRTGRKVRALFAAMLVALGGLTSTRAGDDPKTAAATAPLNTAQEYGAEFAKQSSLLEQLTAMNLKDHQLFIQVLSVTTSDPILNSLLEQELAQETKLAGLKVNFAPDKPEPMEAAAMIDDLKKKIDLRANGIMAGMSIQSTALRAAADNGLHRVAPKVYLVGPVHTPGPLEIPSDEVLTLSKAILRAGGFLDDADRRNVRVTRKPAAPGGKDQVFTVNVTDILEKGKISSDLPLEAGDMIFIPQRLVHF